MDNLILQGTSGYVICFLILNLRNLLYVIEIDVKVKCLEERITQAQLAEMVGTSASYISRLINKKNSIVNKTFVEMLEKLGYDIQITYVKKDL